jgi:hypothetical protein
MHGLPSYKLSFQEEQKTDSKPFGYGEVLQMVQETHRTQGN